MLEVFCTPPGEVAAGRYAARNRHSGHLPPDEATLTRIKSAADLIVPLGLGPTLSSDTSGPVSIDDVTEWLRQQAGRAPY